MTYTSIAILVILGDDLTRLDRKAIIDGELKETEADQNLYCDAHSIDDF